MEIELNLNETIEKNAARYFDRAKALRKKIEGIQTTIIKATEQLRQVKPIQKKEHKTKQTNLEWYEKFRWFTSSDGMLCVGGRDATSNEIIVKKHTHTGDIVLHTETPGSPFFVVHAEGKEIPEQTIKETAMATALYSRAWKLGIEYVDVYYVKPEQLSKTGKPGEFIPRGGFIVSGKRTYIRTQIEFAVGIKEGKIMGGPPTAVQKHCEKYVVLKRGSEKPTEVARKIKYLIGAEIDDIIRVMPANNFQIAAQHL